MIPEYLERLRKHGSGGAWLDRLPQLVAECAEQWQLRLGETLVGGSVSLPIAATLPDGSNAVLKIQFPHRESNHEAAALAHWQGEGAIRLLAHDVERHALLLERCFPGTPLAEEESDVALDVMIDLLPRLWKPADAPFRSLADEAAWWAGYLEKNWENAGKPFERILLDAALDALRVLPGSQGEQVLLHQDLHAGNVLRAEREPWLAMDPKPLTGEREFGIAAIVRGSELGHGRRQVLWRLDRLSDELELNRERALLWSLAQTIAWCSYSDHSERHVEAARWLLQATSR